MSDSEEEMSFGEKETSYKQSPAHKKTMEVLAKTKKASEVTKDELRDYCNLIIDEEYVAFCADDIHIELLKRYQWNFK